MRFIKKSLLIGCAAFSFLLLNSCAKVSIKNTKKCVIAGVWRAGLDCATTLTSETSEMDFEAMISWLEPQPEFVDKDGKKHEAKAGAVCESAEDFTAEKTALEQACSLLKNACTPDIKSAIAKAGANVQGIIDRSKEKAGQTAAEPMLQPFSLPVPEEEKEEEDDPSRNDPPLEAEFQI